MSFLILKPMLKNSYSVVIALMALAIIVANPARAQQCMRISLSNGTVMEIAITDIQKITFGNFVSAPLQERVIQQLLKMKLYPNPATEFVNIEYTLPADGEVIFEIYTLNGTLLKSSNLGIQPEGNYNYRWITSGMKHGAYLCKIKQNREFVSNKVIINN